MFDTPSGASPVPAPATEVSPGAPSGPVGSTVDCCPQAVAFSFLPQPGRSTYGFDAISNAGAVATDDYWDPPEKKKTLQGRETRDGAAWVSVPVGGETVLNISLMGCASAVSCTFEVEPASVAVVVDPKPAGNLDALTIKGLAEGEASLKVMCRGTLVGYFHIWCKKMATIRIGVGAIHVTSSKHTDPASGAAISTPVFPMSTADLAQLKAKLDEIYRQALIEFEIRSLGVVDFDHTPEKLKRNAQELILDGPNSVFDGSGDLRLHSARNDKDFIRWMEAINALGNLARMRTGGYGSYSVWFVPQPDQGTLDVVGYSDAIPGRNVYVFELPPDALDTTAHELGHLMGLQHPNVFSTTEKATVDAHEAQYPAHLRYSDINKDNWHLDDPKNLMGYNGPNNYDLLYRQWKALPRN